MSQPRYWAVVPAAGLGRRFGGPLPKQYLPLDGATVLEHTVARLRQTQLFQAIAVVTHPEDELWPPVRSRLGGAVISAPGGAERSDSVLNGLNALTDAVQHDWILVHDAARPCVRADDVHHLVNTLREDEVGGLLGAPVRDTMKRVDDGGAVVETVARENLWAAFTPQMFRYGRLREALDHCQRNAIAITDEAQAMEAAGFRPRLVLGQTDNIKITRSEDLDLARQYLRAQAK
ncbi:MAG: 2-C-methyl-D-erythritol 4-phosphate cytidylyltransferase [Gammaproteobacteria bacterium]|nr:2-C-methyl-D-erythritol 4-phosphate cytidylyltransferase [Gammaproteobacteria bacterium]